MSVLKAASHLEIEKDHRMAATLCLTGNNHRVRKEINLLSGPEINDLFLNSKSLLFIVPSVCLFRILYALQQKSCV